MTKPALQEELFNKNGLAVMKLAGTLSRYRSGDRIPKICDLAKQIRLSVGTTQYGLNFLRDREAVSITARGHLGTYVDALDYDALREYAGTVDRACVMPLPYSLRYEGLATAFSQLSGKPGRFFLAFMNGSGRRVKALLEGRYDCALVSRLAAEDMIAQGKAIDMAIAYGRGSFLENHVLVHRTKTPGRIQTLGLDRESLDQVLLSQFFLDKRPGVKAVNLPYTHIIRRLLAGEVDAAVWNLDYIKEHHPSLQFSVLDFPDSHESMTEAALVIRSGDAAAMDYISRRFPPKKVLKTQEAVLSGRLIPEY
jgi:hypothetical protein